MPLSIFHAPGQTVEWHTSRIIPRGDFGRSQMTDTTTDTDEQTLLIRLAELKQQHRDLDDAIEHLEIRGFPDQLQIRRLKKQKLYLRDEIAKVEDTLLPDIIA